jgi:hypothetical protein
VQPICKASDDYTATCDYQGGGPGAGCTNFIDPNLSRQIGGYWLNCSADRTQGCQTPPNLDGNCGACGKSCNGAVCSPDPNGTNSGYQCSGG